MAARITAIIKIKLQVYLHLMLFLRIEGCFIMLKSFYGYECSVPGGTFMLIS